jgi:DNA-binding NtrC family response regulator
MRRHVLTIEPSLDIALVLRALLESAGCAVQWAGDQLSARTFLSGPFPPDLIIMEPLGFEHGGLEFYRHVKASHPAIPVIVLTSWLEPPSVREEVLAGGADVFMTKPFDIDRLETEVRRLLADQDDSGEGRRAERARGD